MNMANLSPNRYEEIEIVIFLYSFSLISDTHKTFYLICFSSLALIFPMCTADHKLYGRACCWTGLIWNCVSGDTLTANHESTIAIADVLVAFKAYR